jgi:hypothetical protein
MAVDRADGAALAERAAVVAWLRERARSHREKAAQTDKYDAGIVWRDLLKQAQEAAELADAIERGEHVGGR